MHYQFQFIIIVTAHAIGTSNQVSRWRLGAILVVLVLLTRCSNADMVIIWSCLRY